MKNYNDIFFFLRYIHHLTNKLFFFYLLMIIDFLSVLVGIIESLRSVVGLNEQALNFLDYLKYLSPNYLIKNLTTCTEYQSFQQSPEPTHYTLYSTSCRCVPEVFAF